MRQTQHGHFYPFPQTKHYATMGDVSGGFRPFHPQQSSLESFANPSGIPPWRNDKIERASYQDRNSGPWRKIHSPEGNMNMNNKVTNDWNTWKYRNDLGDSNSHIQSQIQSNLRFDKMSTNPHNLEAPHREARCHNPSVYHRQDRPNQTSVIRYENNQRGSCLTERTQEQAMMHTTLHTTLHNSYLK